MTECSPQRRLPVRTWILVCLLVGLCFGGTASSQRREVAVTRAIPPVQPNKVLYRFAVEDDDEAGLIQQQLKIAPEFLRAGYFYYFGDEQTNGRLKEYGYAPESVQADETITAVRRVLAPKDDTVLRKAGLAIILKERRYWYVRGTIAQLRELTRTGYELLDLTDRPLVPRRIRITLNANANVNQQIGGRVEINSVRQGRERSTIVTGEAFDDAIAELRAKGLKVDLLPDYPGVIR